LDEDLDCHSWNNTAKFLIQLTCILIFGLFIKLIAVLLIKREEKTRKTQKLNQVGQDEGKKNQKNTEV
jgi:preprotein translocase subunit SecG